MIIGAPYPYVVTIIPLTHKAVILILPSRKRKFLSEAGNTRLVLFIGETKLMSPEEPMTIQCPIDAKTLVEAMEKFPQSMERMLKNMMP